MLNLRKFFLDLLFPTYCIGCGREGTWLCNSCQLSLQLKKQRIAIEQYPEVESVLIATEYNQELLRRILHVYKYNFVRELSDYLSSLLVKRLKVESDLSFDLIIPVPLSKKRFLFRGFNQAEPLAQAVGKAFSCLVRTDALVRSRNNRPQVGLNLSQRQANLNGIFAVNLTVDIKGFRILLIDDVATTGTTIGQCARVLKAAGAKTVSALVIAHG